VFYIDFPSHYSLLLLMLQLQYVKNKYLSMFTFDCTTVAETKVLELHVPQLKKYI